MALLRRRGGSSRRGRAGPFGQIFDDHGLGGSLGGRLANNDVVIAHDCHPLLKMNENAEQAARLLDVNESVMRPSRFTNAPGGEGCSDEKAALSWPTLRLVWGRGPDMHPTDAPRNGRKPLESPQSNSIMSSDCAATKQFSGPTKPF
jgi:hypothetical protein